MLGRFGVLVAVFRNPALRRLEAAYLLFSFAEWATWVAVIVYAYGRGGAAEAGLVVFVELAPSVVAAPAVSALGDRFPRARVLLGTYALQGLLMATTAIALLAAAPALLVYALATVTATAVAFSRPVHASLLPEVVSSPDDLTAANVVSGMFESSGSLIGPLGAGILIALGGPGAVFAAGAIANVVGGIAVIEIARLARRPVGHIDAIPHDPDQKARGGVGELIGGLAAIWADRRLRAVVAIATWATFLVGSMDIFYAVLAIDLMGLDESAVGFVGALGGVGAIVGSAAALLLVGRDRLGVALVVSAVLFGVSIAAIAVAPGSVGGAGLLVIAGIGSGLTFVGAQTLIQRLAGDDVMSRVFGALQGLTMGATALGALAVPILIGLVGERAAFAVAGLSLPVVIGLVAPAILRADRLDLGRARELRLLRGVPMLAPLSGPVLERLVACVVPTDYPAGATIINEGDRGDRFFVVADGSLDVTIHGRRVRRLLPGDGFGEIALIRDVPRTATVTSTDPVTLLGIDRGPFIEALTGQPRSRSLAAGLAAERLATDISVS